MVVICQSQRAAKKIPQDKNPSQPNITEHITEMIAKAPILRERAWKNLRTCPPDDCADPVVAASTSSAEN
jgi:hypothetical protein